MEKTKQIINNIVMKAILSWKPYADKPGSFIEGLSVEDRVVLKKATSKDFYQRIK